MRAGQPVLDQIGFIGGDEQVARRDRDQPLRPDTRGQKLHEFGLAARVAIDRDRGSALGGDEDQLLVAEGADLRALGLDALLVAMLGIVAGADVVVLERSARFVKHLAGAREDGEAAAATLVVTLVGDHQTIVVEPFDRVRLTPDIFLAAVEAERAVAFGVDPFKRCAPGGEMASHGAAGGVDDGDVIVFLQGHRDFAGLVEGDEFGLGVLGRDFGDARHVDRLHGRTIRRTVGQREDHDVAGRKLRDHAVVQVLVAFVLDGDGKRGAVGTDGQRIRLAAEIAFRGDRLARKIDRQQLA